MNRRVISLVLVLALFFATTPDLGAGSGKSDYDDAAYSASYISFVYTSAMYSLISNNTYAYYAYIYGYYAYLYAYYSYYYDNLGSTYEEAAISHAEVAHVCGYQAYLYNYYAYLTTSNTTAQVYCYYGWSYAYATYYYAAYKLIGY